MNKMDKANEIDLAIGNLCNLLDVAWDLHSDTYGERSEAERARDQLDSLLIVLKDKARDIRRLHEAAIKEARQAGATVPSSGQPTEPMEAAE